MSFYVDIIRADGRRERFRLAETQSVIGSHEQAHVRVRDALELEPQHLLVLPRGDGCWVSAVRGAKVQPLLDGRTFESGLVPWGSEFDIGAVTVRVLDAAEAESNPGGRKVRLMLMLAMAAFVVHVFTRTSTTQEIPPPPTAAPALFDNPEAAKCPEMSTDPERKGVELVRDAHARLVRAHYDPRDGIVAVSLFDQARMCLTGHGAADRLHSIISVRSRLVERMEDEYRLHRLRLSQALAERDHAGARRETRAMKTLIAHRPGAYFDWLVRVERLMELEIERKSGKRKS